MMKSQIIIFAYCIACLFGSVGLMAQPVVVEPGDKSLNPALLHTGRFTWGSKNFDKEFVITVSERTKEINVIEKEIKKGLEESIKTTVFNSKTFEPISENYKGQEVTYNLQYGTRIKGSRSIFEANAKENLNEEFTGKFFIKEALPFVISSLPLSPSYRVTIPVVNVTSEFKPEYLRYRIKEVSEGQSFSCLSGKHSFWKVVAEEKKYSLELTVFIDKESRRILRAEYNYISNLSTTIFADRELDVNPIAVKFNSEEAKSMLTGGKSTIKGQAYTKDNAPRALSTRSRKIYAPKGSLVTIIPNTAYFKAWVEYNLYISKVSPPIFMDADDFGRSERLLVQGCAYPLPPEVKKETLTTDIVDDNGNFVFQNLKPGEYMIFINFVASKYTHTTKVPNGSYTVTIDPNGTSYASQNVDITHWATPMNITNYKFVVIKTDGETVKAKLD